MFWESRFWIPNSSDNQAYTIPAVHDLVKVPGDFNCWGNLLSLTPSRLPLTQVAYNTYLFNSAPGGLLNLFITYSTELTASSLTQHSYSPLYLHQLITMPISREDYARVSDLATRVSERITQLRNPVTEGVPTQCLLKDLGNKSRDEIEDQLCSVITAIYPAVRDSTVLFGRSGGR